MFTKIWNFVVDIFDSMARARAAGELARQGHYQAARDLMDRANG